MKIIGAEIRFGVSGFAETEAVVVPLKIEVPAVLGRQGFHQLTMSCTIHTSEGDTTIRGAFIRRDYDPMFSVSAEIVAQAVAEFSKAIEAGS